MRRATPFVLAVKRLLLAPLHGLKTVAVSEVRQIQTATCKVGATSPAQHAGHPVSYDKHLLASADPPITDCPKCGGHGSYGYGNPCSECGIV